MTATHRIGLRFRRSQARTLRNIADRVRASELPNHHAALFDKAADAARTGEPLIVVCVDPLEAVALADGFTQYGVVRPVVDELSGLRAS